MFQLIREESAFRQYDYGEERNAIAYDGAKEPPDYAIENITVPMYMFWGDGDRLIKAEDVALLAARLPSLVLNHKINYEGWNHNDFIYAVDAKKLVYDIITQEMEELWQEKESESIQGSNYFAQTELFLD